jgi:GNAT superfamily N-acetyltransferase
MIRQLLFTILLAPTLSFAAALPVPKTPKIEVRRNMLTPTDSPYYTRTHHLYVDGLHIGSLGWTQHALIATATQIDYFYIHPKFRGQKAGSLLLSDALDRMRNQKFAAATLIPVPCEYSGYKVPATAEDGIKYQPLIEILPEQKYESIQTKLVNFYKRHGFCKNPYDKFDYIKSL